MPSKNHTPKDFAKKVYDELLRLKLRPPKLEILINLFETMYFASLQSEESQRIAFDLIYADPRNPDPNPPPYIRNSRWKYFPLSKPFPMTISSLAKVAKASDNRTSSFVVHPDTRGRMYVWGLIDQGHLFYALTNLDATGYFPRPGIFQASIAGIGHLVAYKGMSKIAELKRDCLMRPALKVLLGGPIHDLLIRGIEPNLQAVRSQLSKYSPNNPVSWIEAIKQVWIFSLCRLLLRVQNYRKGGAILITPDARTKGLNIKYRLRHKRLPAALTKHVLLQIREYYKLHLPESSYLEKPVKEIPIKHLRERIIIQAEMDDSKSEVDGTLWFISLLTRVDGLVLLSPSFEVKGLGVEITYAKEPANVFIALDRDAKKLRSVDYNHYGTRHRSMMRYCAQTPGSIGFVISQDGDVRVMTKARGRLIMWENISLKFPDMLGRLTKES